VQLDHTIVWCRDRWRSSALLTDLLGPPAAVPFGPFAVVEPANGVSLEDGDTDDEPTAQHDAFLVTEREFDQAFGRILAAGLDHRTDPGRTRPYGSGPLAPPPG